MNELTNDKLAAIIREEHLNLLSLLRLCHDNLDRSNEATELVAKAADLLREAARCAEHPGVKRTNCVWIGDVLHAQRNDSPFHSRCGAEISPYVTFIPRVSVPDCEQCIAVLAVENAQRLEKRDA